jgi:hypothetical protein
LWVKKYFYKISKFLLQLLIIIIMYHLKPCRHESFTFWTHKK